MDAQIATRPRWRWLEFFLGSILVTLSIAEVVLYSPPVQRLERDIKVSVKSVQATGQATRVQLAISHGSLAQTVRLAAFPLRSGELGQRSIFIYNDRSFPAAGVSPTVPQGVLDHLSGELVARGYLSQTAGVNAFELADMLRDISKASKRMIVMMTGVLPATVFSLKVDLLSPWVTAGGIAVWGGGAIGFWSGVSGRALSIQNAVGESGAQQLLGPGVIQFPTVFGRRGTVPSNIATALNMSYRFTGAGVLRDAVIKRGGLLLGWYSGAYSSISYLPQGVGAYLIFGGEITDEATIAADLATIVLSGALNSAGPMAGQVVQLAPGVAESTIEWDLPFVASSSGMMLVAFDPSPDGLYFATQLIR